MAMSGALYTYEPDSDDEVPKAVPPQSEAKAAAGHGYTASPAVSIVSSFRARTDTPGSEPSPYPHAAKRARGLEGGSGLNPVWLAAAPPAPPPPPPPPPGYSISGSTMPAENRVQGGQARAGQYGSGPVAGAGAGKGAGAGARAGGGGRDDSLAVLLRALSGRVVVVELFDDTRLQGTLGRVANDLSLTLTDATRTRVSPLPVDHALADASRGRALPPEAHRVAHRHQEQGRSPLDSSSSSSPSSASSSSSSSSAASAGKQGGRGAGETGGSALKDGERPGTGPTQVVFPLLNVPGRRVRFVQLPDGANAKRLIDGYEKTRDAASRKYQRGVRTVDPQRGDRGEKGERMERGDLGMVTGAGERVSLSSAGEAAAAGGHASDYCGGSAGVGGAASVVDADHSDWTMTGLAGLAAARERKRAFQ